MSLSIKLTSNEEVGTGDTISGYVSLCLDKQTNVENLCVRFLGRASVYIHYTPYAHSHETKVEYKKSVRLIRQSFPGNFLEPGTHTYPFEIEVPPCLPPSYALSQDIYLEYVLQASLKQFHCPTVVIEYPLRHQPCVAGPPVQQKNNRSFTVGSPCLLRYRHNDSDHQPTRLSCLFAPPKRLHFRFEAGCPRGTIYCGTKLPVTARLLFDGPIPMGLTVHKVGVILEAHTTARTRCLQKHDCYDTLLLSQEASVNISSAEADISHLFTNVRLPETLVPSFSTQTPNLELVYKLLVLVRLGVGCHSVSSSCALDLVLARDAKSNMLPVYEPVRLPAYVAREAACDAARIACE